MQPAENFVLRRIPECIMQIPQDLRTLKVLCLETKQRRGYEVRQHSSSRNPFFGGRTGFPYSFKISGQAPQL